MMDAENNKNRDKPEAGYQSKYKEFAPDRAWLPVVVISSREPAGYLFATSKPDTEAIEYVKKDIQDVDMSKRCADLEKILREVTQTLVWNIYGECRGWSENLLSTGDAIAKVRKILKE